MMNQPKLSQTHMTMTAKPQWAHRGECHVAGVLGVEVDVAPVGVDR